MKRPVSEQLGNGGVSHCGKRKLGSLASKKLGMGTFVVEGEPRRRSSSTKLPLK
jgi:hypothetical protein